MINVSPIGADGRFASLSGSLSGPVPGAKDFGAEDGRPPLVLLHGLSFDRRIWEPTLQRLQRVDPHRRVLTLDLPGHGRSASRLPHSLQRVAGLVHDAVLDARMAATPVIVGHSMSGGLASIYAAHFPTSGVVNLDAPPDVVGLAAMLQSVAEQIRGPGFAQVWAMLQASFRVDLLPAPARALVEGNCRPRQDVVISYWQHLLDTSPTDLQAGLLAEITAVAAAKVPYLLIAGSDLSPRAGDAMRAMPNGHVEVWAGSGHFPHLAHPQRFLDHLAATGTWTGAWTAAPAAGAPFSGKSGAARSVVDS